MSTVQEGLNITDERMKELLELLKTIREHTDTKSAMLEEIMANDTVNDVEKAYMIFHYSMRTDVKALAFAITGFLQASDATPADAIAIAELVKGQALISMILGGSIEVVSMGSLPPELGDLKEMLRKVRRDSR